MGSLDPRDEPGEELVRRTARNVTFTASGQVVGKVSTLVWTLLAARQLGPGGFGLFALVLAIAQLVSAVVEWGFDSVLVHQGSRDRSRIPALLTCALVCETLVALPAFVITWFWATGSHGGGAVFGVTLALVLAAQHLEICTDTVRGAAGAMQDLKATSVALVVQRLTTAALASASCVLGFGPRGLGLALLSGAMVGVGATAVAGRRTGLGLGRITRADLMAFERRARTVGVSAIVLMALFRLDVVIVSAFEGDRAVAHYAAAYKLFEAMLFVVFSIRSAVFPVMSASRDAARTGSYFEQGYAAAAVLYVPFAVVCLVEAPGIIRLLYGGEYVDAASSSLRWLALAPLTYGAAYLGSASLQAIGKARHMLPAALTATAANLVGNLLLIPVYGIAAAAAVTTGSYAVQAAVSLFLLRREGCRPQLAASVRVPLVGGLVVAAVMLLCPGPLLLRLAIAGLAHLLVVVVLGDREGERFSLVRSLLRRG
ncbi:MAG: hypothetical protein QOJ92_1942 [Frankiales bacterium]|nr:hypothetical protein [Frankiales bacterium]